MKLGLIALREQLTPPDREQLQIPKYALSLLVLAGKLGKDQDTLDIISEGIQQAQEKLSLYDHDHSNQIAAMADLYRQSISNISPRIMVKGQPLFLQNPDTQNRIRALLLAGIRSYKGVRNILDNKLDQLELEQPPATPLPTHANVRGESYYN